MAMQYIAHARFNALERPDRYDDRLETERHSEAASRAAFGVGMPPPDITAWERRYYFRTAEQVAADVAYDAQVERYNADAVIYFQALDQWKKDRQHDEAQSHLQRPVRPVWPRRG